MKPSIGPVRDAYFNLGLNAALVGAVATAVARFDAAGTFEGNGLSEATDANDGTIVTANIPGTYQIEAAVPVDGAGPGPSVVSAGISKNAAGAELTTAPVITMANMLDADTAEAPIDTQIIIKLTATQYLEAGDAIRLHLEDATGIALQARARLRITRVGN